MIVRGINSKGELVEHDAEPESADEIARRKAAAEARRVQTTISASDFFNRFTLDEHAAVWSAATANPVIGVGLTQGLAAGRIDLTSRVLRSWMDALVAVGAITADRETAILKP